MGPSGSGKSTIMNQLGILDVPSSGKLIIDGRDVAGMSSLERTHMRRDIIGYIFQKFYLIPLLSAYENVDTRSSSNTNTGTRPVRPMPCSRLSG